MRPKEILISFAIIFGVITAVFVVAERHYADKRRNYVPFEVDWDNVRDDRSRKLTIHWMGIPRFATATPETWVEQNLEEEFNVEFEPTFIDGNAYQRRKPLMFASGLVPDVFWDGDPLDLQRDIFHGFVLEIPYEVILREAPTYVKRLNENAADAWLYPYWGGRNWGLPTYGIRNLYPSPPLWRGDWLRKVGIEEVPGTLEEMEEALRRFRYDDPDGDGLQNTFGMCPNAQTWFAVFSQVFGAFGVLPYDWMVKDGQVYWGGVRPETREALALLRRWYEGELIDPDFVSGQQGGRQTGEKFVNGQTGYIGGGGYFRNLDMRFKTSTAYTISQLSPGAELTVGKFVVGPHGDRGARVWGAGGHIICFGKHLEREPEKVLRVLHMFEEMARREELWLAARTGVRGEHWDFNQDRGLFHPPPYDQRGEDKKHLLNLQFDLATGFYCACGAPPEIVDKYTPEAELAFRNTHRQPKYGLADVLGKPGVVPSAGEYLNDLRQTQLTYFAEIIRGDRPIGDFEVFVEEWYRLGGRKMTEEANDLYRAKLEIFDRVGVKTADMPAVQTREDGPAAQ